MRYPRAPLWCGEEGGEVLVKKGRRKVGEGERSSRVGLLLGLCLGLMACSMRPFPSFSMCFCGGQMERSGGHVTWTHMQYVRDQTPHLKTKPKILTKAPSGPNICKKFPMNSLDFSSHFWIKSMLFSSTFCTNSLLFSSTSRTFLFTLSTRSCRWYFFS